MILHTRSSDGREKRQNYDKQVGVEKSRSEKKKVLRKKFDKPKDFVCLFFFSRSLDLFPRRKKHITTYNPVSGCLLFSFFVFRRVSLFLILTPLL